MADAWRREGEDQVYLPLGELIGLGPLMLRWPVECFRKIAFMIRALLVQKTSDTPYNFCHQLTPYVADRIELDTQNRFLMALNPVSEFRETYWNDLENYFSRVFFRLSEVEKIEKSQTDYALRARMFSKDNELLNCTLKNINKLAPITIHYVKSFKAITEYVADSHKDWLDVRDKYLKHYSNCVGTGDDEIMKPDGAAEFPLDCLMPEPPLSANGGSLNFIGSMTKDDMLPLLESFIISWARQGQTNPVILARFLHTECSSILTHTDIGRLLPADLFPFKNFGNGKAIDYPGNMYDGVKNDPKNEKYKKRGERLIENALKYVPQKAPNVPIIAYTVAQKMI